jgi:hypothetical protein
MLVKGTFLRGGNPADGSVTRGQFTLGTRITPGKLGLILDRASAAGMRDVRKLRRPRIGLRLIRLLLM